MDQKKIQMISDVFDKITILFEDMRVNGLSVPERILRKIEDGIYQVDIKSEIES